MNISKIAELLDAQVICGDVGVEIETACGSDMMSDVLAFVKDRGILITGLMNPQAVRTAEMLDMLCICFVRGKLPGPEIIELAKERDIAVIATKDTMFAACGKLYGAGIKGCRKE